MNIERIILQIIQAKLRTNYNTIKIRMKSFASSEETKPQMDKIAKIKKIISKALQEIKEPKQKKQCYLTRMSLNLEWQKLEKMLSNLENGYLVKKHSPKTSSYHNKFVYVSQDHRFLCWKSPDKKDQKRIELRKIQTTIMGDECQGMLESKTIKDHSLCIIIVSELRVLEIQCIDRRQFVQLGLSLQEAVRNSKRMHLSYRF